MYIIPISSCNHKFTTSGWRQDHRRLCWNEPAHWPCTCLVFSNEPWRPALSFFM